MLNSERKSLENGININMLMIGLFCIVIVFCFESDFCKGCILKDFKSKRVKRVK